MNRATANLALLLVGAIWGSAFVAQSTAMDTMEPIYFTGIRFVAATIALFPLALWERRRLRRSASPIAAKPMPLMSYALVGALLFFSLLTQQFGLLTTTVTNSGFLTATYVVITPIISVFLFRTRPHWIVWPTAFTILAGLWLLSGGALTSLAVGDVLTLLCALFWAFQVILVGRVVQADARPFALACGQFFTCAVLGLVLAPFFETVTWQSIVDTAPEILFAGVISGGGAFTLQIIAQRYTTAPQAAIFMSSESLFAALMGAWLLSERISPIGYVGCALIFLAILAVELVPMRWPQRA